MTAPTASSVLRAALIAAVVAGAVVGVFHLLASDRIVDQAIAQDDARHAGDDHSQELFSRRTQKAGLVVGSLTYALGMGLVLGGVYIIAGARLPGGTVRRRALGLAAIGLWSLYVAPFLKYPANPPGVGDPGTIYFRQVLYLAFVAFTILGLVAARQLSDTLRHDSVSPRRADLAALAAYAVYFLLLFVLMPGNPDHNDVPTALLRQFRIYSVAGGVLFWILFGLLFAQLLGRYDRQRTGGEASIRGTVR